MRKKLNNCVFISGATGGLGKAFAIDCARRGWDLFLSDLDQHKLEIFANTLRSSYCINIAAAACDLTDLAQREELYERIIREEHRFNFLINVAGLDFEGNFIDQRREHLRTILRLNIESTVDITHFMLDRRIPHRKFHIITVASLAAFYPMPVKATYAASKRFLLNFYLALRSELRAQQVGVSILCPAGLATKPETINSIQSQGWMGEITTKDISFVAHRAINKTLRGRAVYIPGFINQILRSAGALIPPGCLAALIHKRWETTRQKMPM